MSNETVIDNVTVGELLFEFTSFRQWINKSSSLYRSSGVRSSRTIAIDNNNRVCRKGAHFQSASYPVRVYGERVE